jgi:hypothetical protein
VNQSIKIPQPSFQVITSRHSKVFLLIIILSEGQAGEVWDLYNKMMLYSLRPTEVYLNSSSSLAGGYHCTLNLCCQLSDISNETDKQTFTVNEAQSF